MAIETSTKTVYIPIKLFANGELTDEQAMDVAKKIQEMIMDGYFNEDSVYDHANSQQISLVAYDVQQPTLDSKEA